MSTSKNRFLSAYRSSCVLMFSFRLKINSTLENLKISSKNLKIKILWFFVKNSRLYSKKIKCIFANDIWLFIQKNRGIAVRVNFSPWNEVSHTNSISTCINISSIDSSFEDQERLLFHFTGSYGNSWTWTFWSRVVN